MERPPPLDTPIELESVFRSASDAAAAPMLARGVRRARIDLPEAAAIVDIAEPGRASCCFARLSGDHTGRVLIPADAVTSIHESVVGGWLLRSSNNPGTAYWFPTAPKLRRTDADGRILAERPAPIRSLSLEAPQASAHFGTERGWVLDFVAWRLSDPALCAELESTSVVETQPYYLWGSHTPYRRLGDVYLHLIHGAVYESGYAWPHKRKICSENDAHALYVTLSGLERATGKRFYRLLKRQLLLSVLARQLPDGGFRHGEWTDRMESHFRLSGSAMHLFLDALAEEDDPAVREALARLAAFAARQHDKLDTGIWFLHDELEFTEQAMNECPFRWLKSRALGKSETNMLVLNTHLDTAIGLDRFAETTGDGQYRGLVTAARSATRTVLALRPAEWLYRILFSAINLTLLPSARAAALPLPLRAVKRLAWQYLIPRLHHVKTRFPRLVMPGGYIDRAVPLATWAFHYLTININDLVRFRRRFPETELDTIIDDAIRMTRTSGVLDRWRELNYEKYALGFWAEALYQLCVDSPDPAYRAGLAEAILMLEDLELGLPPSLLGANCEAVGPVHQRPCPSPAHRRMRVTNLSCARGVEFLAVNPSTEPVPLELTGPGASLQLKWRGPSGEPLDEAFPIVPARGWAQATA